MTLPEVARLAYLTELARARTALSRELDAVQCGAESLQSLSDALSALRAARVLYCAEFPAHTPQP